MIAPPSRTVQCLAHSHGPLSVDGHDAVPLGLGELVERRAGEAGVDRGVVDEDVDRADLGGHRRDGGTVGDVDGDLGDARRGVVAARGVIAAHERRGQVGADHLVATRGERGAERAAEAAGGARDQYAHDAGLRERLERERLRRVGEEPVVDAGSRRSP